MVAAPRRRRWRVAVSVLLGLLLLAGWWIDRQLEPKRLTALVLEQAGKSLGLRLGFAGEADYAFRPEPRLLIPNLSVRNPVDGKVFLSAARVEISLPWDTITGGKPVITRVELEAPVLDLPGLRRWQASRPPAPFELPTLTRGLRVSKGIVRDHGYSISMLALDLPRLQSGAPAALATSGTYQQGDTALAFDMALSVATAGLASEFSVDGSGELRQSPKPLPFRLQASGHYRSGENALSLKAASLRFDGSSPLPRLDGKLSVVLTEKLALDFSGQLLEWAADWPALPQPLGASKAPMPLQLNYLGASDLSGPLLLELLPADARLQASLRVQELQQWGQAEAGSPLPPLDATLSTPMLEFEGMRLEGVEIEIRDGATPAAGLQP